MCSLPVDRSHSHLEHQLLLVIEEFEFVEEIFHREERSKYLTRTCLYLLYLTYKEFDATQNNLGIKLFRCFTSGSYRCP